MEKISITMEKNKVKEIVTMVFTSLGILETLISAVILIWAFHGLTDLTFQIIVHVVIIIIWLIQRFVVNQMDWGGLAFVFIAILELLIAAYGFWTLYSMTDYVIKSAAMETRIPYIMTGLGAFITTKHFTV